MHLLKLFLLLLLCFEAVSQNVTYNHIVDKNDEDTKEIMLLFENYLMSNPQHQEKNQFWNEDDQVDFKKYDFLEDEFEPSLYMGFPAHVLSIKFKGNICEIKVQFSYCDENGQPNILAIVNYLAEKEKGVFKLHNALSYNKVNWVCESLGNVIFYYPQYHEFNHSAAKKLNEFINLLCINFEVPARQFEYYLANDYDEIQALKGIDYYIGMGGQSSPRGKAGEGKVYCGGLGEYYPHEVFHVLVDKYYPNKHSWVSEGVATLLGGSRGKSLDWHILRCHNFLQEHPEINLSNILELRNLDGQTAYRYVLGGLIARKVFEKGGYALLRQFMSSGSNDEDYYKAIESYLGVKRLDLDQYLKRELRLQSTR